MSLSSGDKLGPYEIIGPIGAGGMGEVYKARDGRLDRVVAIKTSRIAFDQRFGHEARAVAALNHPNICTLHDVGPNYLVMEYVDGVELKGPLPLDRALTLAGQILDALDAAHRKGITHRDLKPANVMVTKTGVKVLDFGLAKIAQPQRTDDEMTRAALTQDNTILGTLHYMAPEQLQGKHDVDSRADIFSFGCVLYEMLTGKRAFDGSNAASIIAAVMERPAPSVEAVAPAALDRVLKRCLEKDPDERWQNARDVKAALELTQFPASAAAAGSAARPRWWVGVVAVAVAVTIGAAWGFRRQTAIEAPRMQASLLAPPDSEFTHAFVGYAVSPNGRLLVFSAKKKTAQRPTLWLRPLNSLTVTELPGTDDGDGVFWSPDSRSIGFVADDKLKRMDVAGGAVQTLCDAPSFEGGSWSTEGIILFGSSREGLRRVPASGGTAVQITSGPAASADRGDLGHRYPHFLPDGRHFLYTLALAPGNAGKIVVASLDNPKQSTQLVDSDAKAEYAPPRNGLPGYLLWLRDQTLLAQPFDGQSKLLKGDPVPLVEGTFAGFVSTGRRASYSVSNTGVLVYRTGLSGFQMTWMDRQGRPEAVTGAADPRDGDPALSPDGRRVALERQIGTNFDVWVYELGRGIMTRLTFDPAIDWIPVWSPDSSEVIYGSTRKDGVGLYRRRISGGGEDELLVAGSIVASSWSRDGRFLLYVDRNNISALPLTGNREDRKPIPYLHTPFQKSNPQFSPDGKWVAYVSNESGRKEIYLQAFPLSGGKWQVTSKGGVQPRWRGDGRELYFLSESKLWAAGIRIGPGAVEIDAPRSLFPIAIYSGPEYIYDVRPDGQRFLLTQPPNSVDAVSPMSVISDWQAGLSSQPR